MLLLVFLSIWMSTMNLYGVEPTRDSISIELGDIQDLAVQIVASCLHIESDSQVTLCVAEKIKEIMAKKPLMPQDHDKELLRARTISDIDRDELIDIVLQATSTCMLTQHNERVQLQTELDARYTKKVVAIISALSAVIPAAITAMVTILVLYSGCNCPACI